MIGFVFSCPFIGGQNQKTSALVHWRCSVCGDCYYLDEPNAEYCPRFGAKMDGKDGE